MISRDSGAGSRVIGADRRDRRSPTPSRDDRVLAFEQRLGRGQAHLLDVLVIDASFSIYVSLEGTYASGW